MWVSQCIVCRKIVEYLAPRARDLGLLRDKLEEVSIEDLEHSYA